MNAIGYVRISENLQSIIAQEAAISNFCAEKGLNLLTVFKDIGTYNEELERESWLALEEYVRYNVGNIKFLLFTLPAKISRCNKMIDYIQAHFKEKYGVILIAVT